MDFFGIGAAILAGARIYQQAARCSGRTTRMVESVKAGDRIVFASRREANRVASLLRERQVAVQIDVVDPKRPEGVLDRKPADGRIIFDHSWIEQYYEAAIERASAGIDELRAMASRVPK